VAKLESFTNYKKNTKSLATLLLAVGSLNFSFLRLNMKIELKVCSDFPSVS